MRGAAGTRAAELGVHACTIAARNYLPWVRVLAESFRDHHPRGKFTVLLIDDTDGSVDASGATFEVLRLDDLVSDAKEVQRMAMLYDVTELATSVKGMLMRHLLDQGRPHLIYLDPDIQIFGPLDDAARLAEADSIVLTPHRTAPMPRDGRKPTEADILGSGIYNLGFLGLGPGSDEFLDYWCARLRRHSLIEPSRGVFTDQRWIDFVPGFFPHRILRDPTYNVAYWNLDERDLRWTGERYEVGGRPLRFFHFSGFDPEAPHLLSKHGGDVPRVLPSEHPDLARLCSAYAKQLRSAGLDRESERFPYAFDRLPNGTPIGTRMRRLYREALERAEDGRGEEPPSPFSADSPEAFLEWLREPVYTGAAGPVSRYLAAIWEDRGDLRKVFPDPRGTDAAGFLNWIRTNGWEEESVPPELMPPPHQRSRGRARPAREGVNLVGYLEAELGTGEAGRLTLAAIEAAGVPVAPIVHRLTLSRQRHPFQAGGGARAPYDINVLCLNADGVGRFVRDFGAGMLEGRHTVGAWAWEVEDFPPGMQRGFGYVDEVWAVSEHAARAIRRVSPRPVFSVPLPIQAPEIPAGLTREQLGAPEGFLFLFMFDFFSVCERKNPHGLLEAFRRAFEPGEGPALLIKSINGDQKPAELERLRMAAADRPDVHVVDGYLSSEERYGLLGLCDCYVSLHRAEGFGLTMAEAMALGKPVIATGYSGNLEFMTPENSFLVPHGMALIPEGCEPYPAGSRWAEPDLDEAARAMRGAFEDPAEAQARGRRAADDVRRLHSLEARAGLIEERLRDIGRRQSRWGYLARARARSEVRRAPARAGAKAAATRALGSNPVARRLLKRRALRRQRGAMAASARRELPPAAAAQPEASSASRPQPAQRTRLAGGRIDLPVEGSHVPLTPLLISGWAVTSPHPVSSVEVRVGGGEPERARLGLPRPDVAVAVPSPAAAICGFETWVDPLQLAPGGGPLAVSALAVSSDGARFDLGTVTVETAGPGATEPAEAAADPGHLRPSVPRAPAPPPSGQRLLAFSHDLERGGAQGALHTVVSVLRERGWAITVLTPSDGPLRADLERAGAEVETVAPLPLDDREAHDAAVAELVEWARQRDFDRVLVNTLVPFHGIEVADSLGLPSVWAVHEGRPVRIFWSWWLGGRSTIDPRLLARAESAIGRASTVVIQSPACRPLFEPHLNGTRCVVVPNGVDLAAVARFRSGLDREVARSRVGLRHDDRAVVCLGSVEPRKGQALIAQAARLLAGSRPQTRFFLVGDQGGNYSEGLHRYLREARLDGVVSVVTHTDRPYEWLAIADLAVCASDSESQPGSILEAIAFGVPVVATRVAGIPDVIEEGKTGYLCEPSQLSSLAAALERALSAGEAERAAVTAAARERVEHNHRAEESAGRYAELIASAGDAAAQTAA